MSIVKRIVLWQPLFLLLILCSCHSDVKVSTPLYRLSLIDSLLSSAVENGEIPGAVAYINRQGREVYHRAFGYKNLASMKLMKEDDIFRMASMTKAMTAVAVLQLYERGLLFLDDKLSWYIPAFGDPLVLLEIHKDSTFTARPAEKEITIRQLLTHTSGIGYGFQDEEYNALVIKHQVSEGFEDDDRTSMENMQRLAELPLLCEPGERYIYSMSYDVLGVVVEVVSGMRFDRYVQRYILDPLKMNDSYFLVPEKEQQRLVKAYEPVESGFIPTTYPDTAYPVLEHRRFFSGGSDLCSTAEDYGKFVQMVLHGGVYNQTRILGERYVDMMLRKQTRLEDGGYVQGFAAWVTNDRGAAEGPMAEGSFGFGGFWDTYSWADPEKDFVAVLLLQMYPGNKHRIQEKFQSITYGIVEDL
jgi:CubicO group peptidase (beta-lactamase class C family)